MIDVGILTDDDEVELLEGLLVQKMVRKPRHDTAVSLAQAALVAQLPATLFCRIQSAISTQDSEPEPDIAVVAAPPRRYVSAHPSAQDIALVVEVADASIERDRHEKARIYARAGIAHYWIVNLVDSTVEACSQPVAGGDYLVRRVFAKDESLDLELDAAMFRVSAIDLLP